MKKKYYLILLVAVFLGSCKSKKAVVAPVLPPVSVQQVDLSNREDSLRLLEQQKRESELKEEKLRKEAEFKEKQLKESATASLILAKRREAEKLAVSNVQSKPEITYSTKKVQSLHAGVEQIANYDFTHPDVPEAFEGFRIAFISDLHYKSLLNEHGLNDLVLLLNAQKADVLLMGGDYQEGCEFVAPLFAALSKVKTSVGIYGVMGNNDYERCHDDIIKTMLRYGMHPLEHKTDTLRKGGQQILLSGVRNPFDLARNGKSPTLSLSPKDFVILLVHTPDYVEDVSVANTDLALAGHTHGGQVRVFGVAPVKASRFGDRFLTGLAYNSAKTPIIVTNGIGTSQMPIRIGAPAEIVMITLHRLVACPEK